jgi:hypothetical protein
MTVARGVRQPPTNVRTLDPKTARVRLDELIARHPETASKLVAAAPKGERLSDETVFSMLEKFQERGALEQRSGEHDGR